MERLANDRTALVALSGNGKILLNVIHWDYSPASAIASTDKSGSN